MPIACRVLAPTAVALFLAACGGGGRAGDPGGPVDLPPGPDTYEIVFTDVEPVDLGRPDDGPRDPGPGDLPPADTRPDPGPGDAPGDATLDADAVARCTDGDQCPTGACVTDPAAPGRICAPACPDGACPSGWSCRSLDGADGVVRACLPGIDLCKPCLRDLDCRPEGLPVRDRCVVLSDGAGSACGLDCLQGEACPEGTECRDVPGTGGAARQCLPVSGTCPCDASWRDATSECFRQNAVGRCKGLRACDGGVETPCTAAEAVPEACDGADDDCDGATDEDFRDGGLYLRDEHCGDCATSCADAYPNGLAACRLKVGAPTCVFQGCVEGHVLEDGACVRDGRGDCGPCAVDADCHQGWSCAAVGGASFCLRACGDGLPGCPDGLACLPPGEGLAPACLRPDGGCAAPGSPCLADGDCDDRNACTNDVCVDHACTFAPVDCRDGNDCTLDACFPDTGCSNAWLPEGDPCSDGDSCTVGDACRSGACVPGLRAPCDDGQPCTDDSCRDGICVHVPNDAYLPCYDGPDGTKGVGTCIGGVRKCVGGLPSDTCVGQVLPAVPESCDGRDDGCSGVTDAGCEIVGVDLRPGAAALAGSLGLTVGRMEAVVGAGPGQSLAGPDYLVFPGFFAP